MSNLHAIYIKSDDLGVSLIIPHTNRPSSILPFQFTFLIKYRICKVIRNFRSVPAICYMFSLRLISFQSLRMEEI